MMNAFLVIVGKSGVGKTRLARELEGSGYSRMKTYTTRSKRGDRDNEYIFLTGEEFDALPVKDAEGTCRDYRYCCNYADVDSNDFVILDPVGAKKLLEEYKGDKKVEVLYLLAEPRVLKERLKYLRGWDMSSIKEALEAWEFKLLDTEEEPKVTRLYNETEEDFDLVVASARHYFKEAQLHL